MKSKPTAEWSEVKLGEIVDILGDGLHGTPKYDDNGEYYFINGRNLKGKILLDNNTKRVNYNEFVKYKKDLNDRTIFLSINGTIGNIAYYNNEKVVLGKSACYFNVKKSVCKDYIMYILMDIPFRNYSDVYATGTTIKNLGLKQIREFSFKIPPIIEQKAIADTLLSLDTKIELNNKINKNLEAQAQAIFKHWFVDFEFPHENGGLYKSSGGEMIESELGMIPKGWGVCRLDEITNITMGQSPKGTTYNELGEGEVFYQGRTDFTSRFPHRRLYTTDPKRMASQGDILMSVRAPVGDINIANEDCCIGRGLCSLNSKSNMNSYLLYTLLKLKDQYNIYNGEGTVFGSINQKELKGLKVVKPIERLIEKYDKLVSSMDRKYWVLDKENRTLTKLRDALLPKLMSGELRIPLD